MFFGESVLGKLAMTFFMAMVPVVELRGAIAAGVIIAGCITTAVTCGVAGLM